MACFKNTKYKNPGFVLLSCLICFMLTSCVTERRFSFEVLTPAQLPIATSVQNVTLINHGLKAKGDSAGSYYSFINKIAYDSVPIDTMLTYSCLYGLLDIIEQSNRFNVVSGLLHTPTYNNQKLPSILPYDTLQSLSGNPLTNAAIVLESVETFDAFDYSNSLDGSYFTNLDILVQSKWRIYALDNREVILRQTRIDTISWYSAGASWDKANENIPDRYVALEQAASEAGGVFGKLITPSFRKVNRIWFVTDNPSMQKAADYVQKGDWTSAAKLWNGLATAHKNKLASLAAFNMALTCELKGELELAIYWIERSCEIKLTEKNQLYKTKLQERVAQLNVLEAQLNLQNN
jgi:hypothetical protein